MKMDSKTKERVRETNGVAISHCAHQKKWRKLATLEKQSRKDLG